MLYLLIECIISQVVLVGRDCGNGLRLMSKNLLTNIALQKLTCSKPSPKSYIFTAYNMDWCRMNAIPWWSRLSHFSNVIAVDFLDASKYEDMLKVSEIVCIICGPEYSNHWWLTQIITFAMHNIVTSSGGLSKGYALLLCLRSYSYLDLYASLDMHTESTILQGRFESIHLAKRLEVSIHSNQFCYIFG